ncbi:MAG: carbonic anhydrase [Xanthomonadales bacterium]|nr:carbonic anhydrase [Gammaproteobacteria bacterium]MBT8053504.1 carbonic anhydrase [Gammaproteobacteria bacterium]NND55872.1 carbonic anhydrase [Xanthomonadales bacterium]NNK50908.1 carbonic anhydrase [Xanthomonadales bacterium]
MISSLSALDRLKQGNRRFVTGKDIREISFEHSQSRQSPSEQRPFAIVLGCSDSRVPAELVFNQGLGDLFVIRVAGNIVRPSQIGSVEYAAETFGTKLVVVLGHSLCGAVLATLNQLQQPSGSRSPNFRPIVDFIRPSVESCLASGHREPGTAFPDELLQAAVRANIRASVDRLKQGSEILEKMIKDERLLVVGAEYSVETGVVEFLVEET